jgi:hypothetical protein
LATSGGIVVPAVGVCADAFAPAAAASAYASGAPAQIITSTTTICHSQLWTPLRQSENGNSPVFMGFLEDRLGRAGGQPGSIHQNS